MANELLSWLSQQISTEDDDSATAVDHTSKTDGQTTPENITITEDGVSKVYNTKYDIDVHYSDNNFSEIDATKTITVDSSQINLTQEQNSQVIPFKMPRYYDGIDLNEMTVLIHYQNADSGDGVSEPINLCYDDEYIYFYWLVDETVTAAAGSISFEIIATGLHNNRSYIWRSRPNSELTVLEGLDVTASDAVAEDTWLTYLNKVTSIEDSITKITDETLSERLSENYYNKTQIGKPSDWNVSGGQTLINYISNLIDEKEIYIATGDVSSDGTNLELTFNDNSDETSHKITIPINKLIDISKYYSKDDIGDWKSTEVTEGTLVKYINDKTSLNYATKDEVGSLPSNVQEGITSVTDYIGEMNNSFYEWVIDLRIDDTSLQGEDFPEDFKNPLTYNKGKDNEDIYKYFYTNSVDGSEFFTNLITISGLHFSLYEDIELDNSELDNDSKIETAVDKIFGKNSEGEKDASIYSYKEDESERKIALAELFELEENSLNSASIIANYKNYKDKFDNHYIKANLNTGLSLTDAPDADVFYRIVVPSVISTSDSDKIKLIQVPVRKQYYSSGKTIVEYINNLESRINNVQANIDESHAEINNSIESFSSGVQVNTDDISNLKTDIGNWRSEEDTTSTLVSYIDNSIAALDVDSKVTQDAIINKLGDYYVTTADYNTEIEILEKADSNLKDYVGTIPEGASSTNVVSYISELIKAEDITGKLTNYATKKDVADAVANLDIISDSDLLDYITEQEEQNGGE